MGNAASPTEGVQPQSKLRVWHNTLTIVLLDCLLFGVGCFVLLGRYLRERMDLFHAAV